MEEKQKNIGLVDPEEWELAGLGARFVAYFIDGCIQGLAFIIVALILGWGDGGASFLVQIGAFAWQIGYYWYFWTRRNGQTPGKFAMGILVVKADGSELSDTDAVIRAIGYYVSSIVCALGFIWAIFDKNKQGWHDKLAGTYVIRKDSTREFVQR